MNEYEEKYDGRLIVVTAASGGWRYKILDSDGHVRKRGIDDDDGPVDHVFVLARRICDGLPK